jgi:hypothetical protein
MSGALDRRLSKLEARWGSSPNLVVIGIFDPLEGENLEERIAAAEQEASARGEQLIAITIRDPEWRAA